MQAAVTAVAKETPHQTRGDDVNQAGDAGLDHEIPYSLDQD